MNGHHDWKLAWMLALAQYRAVLDKLTDAQGCLVYMRTVAFLSS